MYHGSFCLFGHMIMCRLRIQKINIPPGEDFVKRPKNDWSGQKTAKFFGGPFLSKGLFWPTLARTSSSLSSEKNFFFAICFLGFLSKGLISLLKRMAKKIWPFFWPPRSDFGPFLSACVQIKHRKNCECCPGHYLIVR